MMFNTTRIKQISNDFFYNPDTYVSFILILITLILLIIYCRSYKKLNRIVPAEDYQ